MVHNTKHIRIILTQKLFTYVMYIHTYMTCMYTGRYIWVPIYIYIYTCIYLVLVPCTFGITLYKLCIHVLIYIYLFIFKYIYIICINMYNNKMLHYQNYWTMCPIWTQAV